MNKEELFNNYLKECENICMEYQTAIYKLKTNNKDFFKLEHKEFKKELKEKMNYLCSLNNKFKSYESLLKNL
jgi:hypothetical protein